jgi:hypothetical protein
MKADIIEKKIKAQHSPNQQETIGIKRKIVSTIHTPSGLCNKHPAREWAHN